MENASKREMRRRNVYSVLAPVKPADLIHSAKVGGMRSKNLEHSSSLISRHLKGSAGAKERLYSYSGHPVLSTHGTVNEQRPQLRC